MGVCVIVNTLPLAAIDWASYLEWTGAILMAALGLGLIIFVHELGHFAVAKWCGVKCEKFFIGFDIGGYKLSRKWGETEYGIGILPLGGYVKMLGQNDDPRVTTEQVQESQAQADTTAVKDITLPDGQHATVDERSYLAKSVPQRMAIISAGVIMNIIFAFVFATIAFRVGVPSIPCIVGSTVAGSPAWQQGLRPDERITRMGEIADPWFDQLRAEVTLASRDEALDFTIEKASGDEVTMTLAPDRTGALPAIGITNTYVLELADKEPALPHSPAAAMETPLPGGAKIVSVDGEPIKAYADWLAQLVAKQSQPLTIVVQPETDEDTTPAPVEISLPANQRDTLGIVVATDPVSALEKGGPAEQAGMQVGDAIVSVDGTTVGVDGDGKLGIDPVDLPEYLRQAGVAGKTVAMVVKRGESEQSLTITPRPVTWIDSTLQFDDPIGLSAIGAALPLTSKIVATDATIELTSDKLQAGDRIVAARFVAPKGEGDRVPRSTLDFAKYPRAWGVLLESIQDLPDGTLLKLSVARTGVEEPLEVQVKPYSESDAFTPERGLVLKPLLRDRVGKTLGEQLALGWNETWHSLTSVYRFLARLTGGDISPTMLGGPITIAKQAGFSAMEGWGRLLLFMTLISANLAVINFLPIPLLDGGHMVFLMYEAIAGRPANDRIVMGLQLAGFAFLITLMLFVFGLDLGLISRT